MYQQADQMAATATASTATATLEEREGLERARLEALFKQLGLRTHEQPQEEAPWQRTALGGLALLLVGLAFFGFTLYSVALSKLLPAPSSTAHPPPFAIHEDRYYCLLLPWTLPPTVIVLYLNWLGLEFYRTN